VEPLFRGSLVGRGKRNALAATLLAIFIWQQVYYTSTPFKTSSQMLLLLLKE
jgi:hypothetical protein